MIYQMEIHGEPCKHKEISLDRRSGHEATCYVSPYRECLRARRFRHKSLVSTSLLPVILSVIGVIGIGIGGWLNGEMVYVKSMAVETVEKLAKKVEEQPRLRRVS
jgi:hypothetical protein